MFLTFLGTKLGERKLRIFTHSCDEKMNKILIQEHKTNQGNKITLSLEYCFDITRSIVGLLNKKIGNFET